MIGSASRFVLIDEINDVVFHVVFTLGYAGVDFGK